MVVASEESDTESKTLSNPKVLEFKSGLLTCFTMIKSRQGKISADEIDARVDDWYHSKDVRNGNLTLSQLTFLVKKWTCERYGI